MPELNVGDVLDRFRLTGLISRGLTSSVFKAQDLTRGATVALKVPHPAFEGDAVFTANLSREERICSRLAHETVLKAFTPAERSRAYLVSEYVDGVPLRMRMQPHQPLTTDQALSIVRQLADTLVYVHGQHVIHRDLKPENVHLKRDGTIKVLDFGLALDHPRRLFSFLGSTTVGTPDYMAPEQARGLPGDERSDIYAVGVILYEMLTGELPFPMADPAEVMLSKVESDPLPPTHFRPDLPPELEEIILHAIERKPAQRYPTAAALAADLSDPSRVRLTGRAARLRPRTVRQLIIRRVVRYGGLGVTVLVTLIVLVWLANKYPAGPPAARPAAGAHPAGH
ncbi:MAG TPA: serine/threonine-protein kinase [Gemmatimonadales bacterium]|nr:serine/threonine-protein kinase [Gemmatimonadales bacterium]